MSLRISAVVSDRDVEVDLEILDGQRVALLGPNGAGKSTVLGLVSGLIRPDHGQAFLDGEPLFETGRTRSLWRPPHARATALLAQEALLFPHLSVLDNVAFGPRSAGRGRAAARAAALRWLEEVGAAGLAGRKPAQLSGGQAQRVAVARALAADPRLLLLDEPMAALDVTVVPALRQMLRWMLAGRTTLIVTHDILDAFLLADRVLVMEGGRIVEDGPPREVLVRPRSEFGARIAGLNIVRGPVVDGGVQGPAGTVVHGMSRALLPADGQAVAVFDPAAVSVHLDAPGGSPRNIIATAVTELEPRGSQIRVRTEELSADLTATAVAELDLVPGKRVFLAVKASAVDLYPV